MVFELTYTQEASHNFIYPELTNGSISVELTFARALAFNIEILFLGERSSTFYVTSRSKVPQNLSEWKHNFSEIQFSLNFLVTTVSGEAVLVH